MSSLGEEIFDTDAQTLFAIDHIDPTRPWKSAKIFQKVIDHTKHYDVWIYSWDPITDQEERSFCESFTDFEVAKQRCEKILAILK